MKEKKFDFQKLNDKLSVFIQHLHNTNKASPELLLNIIRLGKFLSDNNINGENVHELMEAYKKDFRLFHEGEQKLKQPLFLQPVSDMVGASVQLIGISLEQKLEKLSCICSHIRLGSLAYSHFLDIDFPEWSEENSKKIAYSINNIFHLIDLAEKFYNVAYTNNQQKLISILDETLCKILATPVETEKYLKEFIADVDKNVKKQSTEIQVKLRIAARLMLENHKFFQRTGEIRARAAAKTSESKEQKALLEIADHLEQKYTACCVNVIKTPERGLKIITECKGNVEKFVEDRAVNLDKHDKSLLARIGLGFCGGVLTVLSGFCLLKSEKFNALFFPSKPKEAVKGVVRKINRRLTSALQEANYPCKEHSLETDGSWNIRFRVF